MPKNPQLQFFQAAFILLAFACLMVSPQESSGAKTVEPAIANSTCPPDLRVIQVTPDAVLNLRTKPKGAIINQLTSGQVVFFERSDRTGTWAKITLSDSAGIRRDIGQGWVLNQHLATGTGCPNSLG